MLWLGARAANNKSLKTKYLSGAIRVEVRKTGENTTPVRR
jgi:hypothetical protein